MSAASYKLEVESNSLDPRPFPDFIPQPWRNIFLHSCKIKSGSGLGMRLGN